MKREPRYKLFRINPDQVLAMLNWNTHDQIVLPIINNVPPDASIETVDYSMERRCFIARVYHESFDPVSMGAMIPIDKEWLEIEERVITVEAYRVARNAIAEQPIKNDGSKFGNPKFGS
jgi:hypothetical protein